VHRDRELSRASLADLPGDGEIWSSVLNALDPLTRTPRYVGTFSIALNDAATKARQLPGRGRSIAAKLFVRIAATSAKSRLEFDQAVQLAATLDPDAFNRELVVTSVLAVCMECPPAAHGAKPVVLAMPFVLAVLTSGPVPALDGESLGVIEHALREVPEARSMLLANLNRLPATDQAALRQLLRGPAN
jgi:hypothetical protein